MKQFKRVLSLLLVVCLVSTSSLAAGLQAQSEAEVTPRFTYIADIATGLSINSAGKATCSTNVTIYIETHSCRIEMTLQRDSGSGWDDVKTWTQTGPGISIDIEKNWYIVPGYDYQVESTIYVYNVNGRLIETTTTHSPIKSY